MAGISAQAQKMKFNSINRHNMNSKNVLCGLAIAVVLQLGMLAGSAQTNIYLYSGSETNITLPPGTYIITAYGAVGGSDPNTGTYAGAYGGAGALMSAEFNFPASTNLTLLVGGAGGGGDYSGGGGGGSFVVEGSIPLVIAGGGGGSGYGSISVDNSYFYAQGGVGNTALGGTGGDGAGNAGRGGGVAGGDIADPDGAGGGGFRDNGETDIFAPLAGGSSFENGGAGGASDDGGGGGFGGGGGDGGGGGGGGGGFGGGGGGADRVDYGTGGGGGGSIIDSSAITNLTKVSGTNSPDDIANGEIIITAVPPPPLVIITTNATFGFTNGLFGFDVSGPSGSNVVIQASTDLHTWIPLQTNLLGSGPFYFSDPQSTTNVQRFYRAQLSP
jgi:hypothetical protein